MYTKKLASISTSRCWKNEFLAEKSNSVLCKNIRKTMALIGILLLVAIISSLQFNLPEQHSEKKDSVLKSRLEKSIPESVSCHLSQQNYECNEYEDVLEERSTKPRTIWNNYTEFEYSQNTMTFSLNFSEAVLQSEFGPKIHLKVYLGQSLSDYETKKKKKNAIRNLYNDSVSMIFTKINLEITTFQMTKSNFSDKCYEVV